jgi:hypothetical protein
MSCGNQPAYISVIIVAALPSVDGTTAQKAKSKAKRIKEKKPKSKPNEQRSLTSHSISAGGASASEQPTDS